MRAKVVAHPLVKEIADDRFAGYVAAGKGIREFEDVREMAIEKSRNSVAPKFQGKRGHPS